MGAVSFQLWTWQGQLVRKVRETLPRHRRVGLVAPTGSGKTAMAAYMSLEVHKQIGGRPGACLYLVHRKELRKQSAETLDEIGLSDAYGYIASGLPMKPWAPMQIASIPTIVRRLDDIEWLDPVVIFVDEGHHATAYTWAKIIKRFPNAFVILMTATPMRNDDSGLGDIVDVLVCGPQISELQPEYMAPVNTFAVPPSFTLTRQTIKAQAAAQTSAVIGSTLDNWRRIAPGGKTIFFAVDIDHSERIVERLRAEGVSAVHLDYKTPDTMRDRAFEDMRAGRIQCVSNVKLFTEGTDWPECDTVVLARNTTSLVDYRQMNGRMMRRKHDGRPGTVIDCVGNVHLHGLPDADVDWELEYGAENQKKKTSAATTQVCEMCSFVFPKTDERCPLCGLVPLKPAVMEVDVKAVEVDGSKAAAPPSKPTKRQLSAEIVATGGDLAALEEIRRRYGYHRNWPARMKNIYRFAFEGGDDARG